MSLAMHLLLGASIVLLASGSTRIASALGARGLELIVAAAPVAAAVMGLSSLSLGFVHLGGTAWALSSAACLFWCLTRALRPVDLRQPFHESVKALRTAERCAIGAVAGATVASAAWYCARPMLGFDPLYYHLPESILWAQGLRPGSGVNVLPGFPVSAYPLTNEVLVSWGTAIGRSFAFGQLWTPACLILFGIAGWTGMRRLRIAPLVRGLALASVALAPVVGVQLEGPGTDLPALAWLAAGGALTLAAHERRGLFCPALLALALAVGTKTTTIPLAMVVLALGTASITRRTPSTAGERGPGRVATVRQLLRQMRHVSVRERCVLMMTIVASTLLGASWYVRNSWEFGSPFWPFVRLPGSKPLPPPYSALKVSFLQSIHVSLAGRTDVYLHWLGGAVVLLAAGSAAALLCRHRPVVVAGLAACLGTIGWGLSPVTGVSNYPGSAIGSIAAIRYLLPEVGAAALAVALAAPSSTGGRRWIPVGVLVVAVSLSLWELKRPLDGLWPAPSWLVIGALVGSLLCGLQTTSFGVRRVPVVVVAVLAIVSIGLGTAWTARGFTARHAAVSPQLGSSRIVAWLAQQPRFRDDDMPVLSAQNVLAVYAGDRLQHRIALVRDDVPCADLTLILRDGWFIIGSLQSRLNVPPQQAACLRGVQPLYLDDSFVVYGTT